MLLLLGNGTSKTLIAALFVNSNSSYLVQDVKHRVMIAFRCKGNALIISIFTVFSNGHKKEVLMNALLIEKSGFLKIDFLKYCKVFQNESNKNQLKSK